MCKMWAGVERNFFGIDLATQLRSYFDAFTLYEKYATINYVTLFQNE